MKDIFDSIKQILDEDKTLDSVVGNLHGVIDTPAIEPEKAETQEWLVTELDLPLLPSYFEALNRFTLERPAYELVRAQSAPVRRIPLAAQQTTLFYTVAKVPNPRLTEIRALGEGHDIAVYVDGVLLGTSRDEARFEVPLDQGSRQLLVLFSGGVLPTSVAMDAAISSTVTELVPSAPAWFQAPEFYVLDPQKGQVLSRLRWINDALATSWQIYRAATNRLNRLDGSAALMGSTTADAQGVKTTKISGAHTLQPDQVLYTMDWVAGILESASYDAGTDVTTLVIRPAYEAPAEVVKWDGMALYTAEPYQSLGRVGFSGTEVQQYDDLTVAQDQLYLYRITAYGLLGQTESPFSRPEWIWTNDYEAPGPISLDPALDARLGIRIETDNVTATFKTPKDPDYAGVHVYGPYPLNPDGTFTPPAVFAPSKRFMVDAGEPDRVDQLRFRVPKDTVDSVFYLAAFDKLGNEQVPEAYTDELGNTIPGAARFTYDGPLTLPSSPQATIELNVLDEKSTDEKHWVELKAYPLDPAISVEVYVDGVLLTSTTQTLLGVTYPALVQEADGADHKKYHVELSRLGTQDTTRLIATVKGTGFRPMSVAYVMDRDSYPGLSSVQIEDRMEQPIIRATMDDDAKWLRVVKGSAPDAPAASDILHTVTRLKDIDTALVADVYDVVQLVWNRGTDFPTPLALNGSEQYRIDASKDGVNWWTSLWKGLVYGPAKDSSTPTLKLSVQVVNTVGADGRARDEHRLTIEAFPTNAAVSVTVNGKGSADGVAQPTQSVDGLGNPIPGQYSYLLVTKEGEMQTLMVTAELTLADGTKVSTTAPYTVDTDRLPGVSAAYVEDHKKYPSIRAYMDDDAWALRLMRKNNDGTFTQVGLPTIRGTTGNLTLHWTSEIEFLPEAEVTYRIDASAENSTTSDKWRIGVWQGVVHGPPVNTVTAGLQIVSVTGTDPTYDVRVKVTPASATLEAKINGTVVAAQSNPAPGEFVYRMTRSFASDTTLVVTATGSGLEGSSITYTIDRDDEPGAAVSMESRRKRPTIRATMDDDSKALRLVRISDSVVVQTQLRANGLVLVWTRGADLGTDIEEEYRLDASKVASPAVEADWKTGIWFGKIQGPAASAPGIKLSVAIAGNTHTITANVYPTGATIGGELHEGSTKKTLSTGAGGGIVATANPGEYTVTITRSLTLDQKLILTSTFDGVVSSATYIVDKDYIPGAWVDKADGIAQPTLRITMDDDAKAVRVVRASDNAVLASGSRTSLGGITLSWTYGSGDGAKLGVDQSLELRVEASASEDLTNFPGAVVVWRGAIRGPFPNNRAVAIQISQDTSVTDPLHKINFTVAPSDASVVVQENGTTVAHSGTNGSYSYQTSRRSDSDVRIVITASHTNAEIAPASVTYTIDRDNIPDANVSVADRRANVVITAVADDDAKRIRFVKDPDGVGKTYFKADGDASALTGDKGTDTSSAKVQERTITLGVEAEEVWAVEVTDDTTADGTGAYGGWRQIWKHRLKGSPQDTKTLPPEMTIEMTGDRTFFYVKAAIDLTLTAKNPNGNGVTLKYKYGSSADWVETLTNSAGDTQTKALTVSRIGTKTADRLIVARAEITDAVHGVIYSDQTFLVDYDELPEVAGVGFGPYPATGKQTGWTANVSVDDDTQSVKIDLTGNLTFSDGTATKTVATNSTKSWAEQINQSIGGSGTVTVTPYDAASAGGNAGQPFKHTLSRAPVTTATLLEISPLKLEVRLSSDPTITHKHYRITGGNTPTTGWISKATQGDLKILLERGGTDIILEYFSEIGVGEVLEEVQKLYIDTDKIADVKGLTMTFPSSNRLNIQADLDDDTKDWELYARRGAWPTQNGAQKGVPDPDFLRYRGPRTTSSLSLYALAGAWYVVAVPYDWSGRKGEQREASGTVPGTSDTTVSPTAAAELKNISVEADYVNNTQRVVWTPTNLTASHTVKVFWKIEGSTSAYTQLGTDYSNVATASVTHTVSFDANGSLRGYLYKLELWEGTAHRGTYDTSYYDTYKDGTSVMITNAV